MKEPILVEEIQKKIVEILKTNKETIVSTEDLSAKVSVALHRDSKIPNPKMLANLAYLLGRGIIKMDHKKINIINWKIGDQCPNCKDYIFDEAKFCQSCGKKLKS
jgi:rRNA maturation endonuclease Nob1